MFNQIFNSKSVVRYKSHLHNSAVERLNKVYGIDKDLSENVIKLTRKGGEELGLSTIEDLTSFNLSKLVHMLKFEEDRYSNFKEMSDVLGIPFIAYYTGTDLTKVNASLFTDMVRKEIDKNRESKIPISEWRRPDTEDHFVRRLCRKLSITTEEYRKSSYKYYVLIDGNPIYSAKDIQRIYGITYKNISDMLMKMLVEGEKDTTELRSKIYEIVDKLTYEGALYTSTIEMLNRLEVDKKRFFSLFRKETSRFHKELKEELKLKSS